MGNLLPLSRTQIKAAGELLARALHDDSFYIHLIPDNTQRKKKLAHLFESVVCSGLYYGEVYATSAKLEGVAVWRSPGNTELSVWKQIRVGMLSLVFKLGWKAISRDQSAVRYESSVHERRAPFPHWYLNAIAVDPPFQGKGYASRLLRPMLARIDKEHLPCYLETENEKNLPIYEHYQFKVVHDAIIPGTAVRQWAMLREKSP